MCAKLITLPNKPLGHIVSDYPFRAVNGFFTRVQTKIKSVLLQNFSKIPLKCGLISAHSAVKETFLTKVLLCLFIVVLKNGFLQHS